MNIKLFEYKMTINRKSERVKMILKASHLLHAGLDVSMVSWSKVRILFLM